MITTCKDKETIRW